MTGYCLYYMFFKRKYNRIFFGDFVIYYCQFVSIQSGMVRLRRFVKKMTGTVRAPRKRAARNCPLASKETSSTFFYSVPCSLIPHELSFTPHHQIQPFSLQNGRTVPCGAPPQANRPRILNSYFNFSKKLHNVINGKKKRE